MGEIHVKTETVQDMRIVSGEDRARDGRCCRIEGYKAEDGNIYITRIRHWRTAS